MINIDTITCQLRKDKILYLSWLDYDPFMKLNFENYFFNIIEMINKEHIKKAVLDCSCRRHHPSDEDFKEIFELFLSGLSTTKLEKMSRICPENPTVSTKFNKLLKKIITDLNLSFEFRNFKEVGQAYEWFKEGKEGAVSV